MQCAAKKERRQVNEQFKRGNIGMVGDKTGMNGCMLPW